MKYIVLVLVFFTSSIINGQEKIERRDKKTDSLSLSKKAIPLKPIDKLKADTVGITIKDYKIITFERDTTFLDTTLTIQKEYKYNYLREDDFELMSFSNIGQAYNTLGVDLERINIYPSLGATAKDRKYLEKE